MCFIFSANAGYIVKGKNIIMRPDKLKNFTLTIDQNGHPLSAGTMFTFDGGGRGFNTIVIIDTLNSPNTTIFPFTFGPEESFDLEVRDFYYDGNNEKYVLCGSRTNEYGSRAFVAEIDFSFFSINYVEYSGVDVFYSICVPNNQSFGYYTCGRSGNTGAVCSVARVTLQLSNCFTTDVPWEYHKIIAKPNSLLGTPRFFISGRDPGCSMLGFSMITPSFLGSSYVWAEPSEPEAHCVITDYTLDNRVIVASSYMNSITLNPIPIPVPILGISAYRHIPSISSYSTRYCVQDIGVFEINALNPRVSVAGYVVHEPDPVTRTLAWHGYVTGFSPTNTLQVNKYFGNTYEHYKHYKIRRIYPGKEYTGGDFQGLINENFSRCALFGTPLVSAPYCDHPETFIKPDIGTRFLLPSFNLEPHDFNEHVHEPIISTTSDLDYKACTPFKGGNDAPKYSMTPPENETEITNFYDRITVKDTPSGTNYQIYSVTGQLIQTGTTNPDISTVNLSKGMYILRLETGKAFKFVK